MFPKTIIRYNSKYLLNRRFTSSVSNIPQLIESSNIDAIKTVLSKPSAIQSEFPDDDISLKIKEIFKNIYDSQKFSNDELISLHNLVLANFLPLDRSLSMIHQTNLKKLQGAVSLDALVEILKFNSGRLHTSWELFEKYYPELQLVSQNSEDVQKLLQIILEKLINGDDNPIREEEKYEDQDIYTIGEEDLVRAVFIYKNLSTENEEIRSKLFNRALELKDYKLAQVIGIDTIEGFNELRFSDIRDELFCYHILTYSNPHLETSEILSNLLIKLNSAPQTQMDFGTKGSLVDQLENLNLRFSHLMFDISTPEIDLSTSKLVDSLSEVVTTNETSLLTKVKALKTFGFSENKSEAAILRLFEEMASKVEDPTQLNEIKDTLLQIMTYRYFTEPSPTLIDKIQVLLSTSIKSLQCLLLLSYKSSNIDAALQIYNDQIAKVSKTPNERGISDASSLTETLVVSYLLNGDREFANLIHDGAIMNDIIQTDTAKAQVKKEFKRYGDVFGEEDQSKVQELVHEWSKEYLRSL